MADRARGRAALAKAKRMLAGAERSMVAGDMEPALLSYVNAAIHASDAICIFVRGHFAQGDDHSQATALLREAAGREVAAHLNVVLDAKKRLTYDVAHARSAEVKRVGRAAEALVAAAARL